MKKRVKTLLFSLAAATCAIARAAVVVTIDDVVQHFPYDGKVDITYTLAGVDDPADYTLGFSCIEGAATNALATFAVAPTLANGTYTLSWNAQADGVAFSSGVADFAASIRANMVYDGDYMIIDVSGGNTADYPVVYTNGVASSAVFNTDEFKTSKIVLKKISAGTFLMGSPEDEEGRNTNLYDKKIPDETQHYVRISKDFFLSLFPVTQAQFCNVSTMANPSFSSGQANAAKRIVEQVIRNTHVFGGDGFFSNLCARATFYGSPFTGFTLPTESQWEYACRAGTTTAWFFGVDSADYETYCLKSQSWPPVVGQKAPNPWGFYDFANVFEWCRDTSGTYPAGTAESPAVDPFHTGGSYAAVRGSTSSSEATIAYRRSASRWTLGANTRNSFLGFRVLVDAKDTSEYESKDQMSGVTIDASSTQTDINAAELALVTNRVEYTGSAIAAPVVLTHGGRTLSPGTDYTLAYSDNVNLGTCIVTVTGIGDFTRTRQTSFRIVSPCVAESQKVSAKVDLRADGILAVTVPATLFELAYNNADGWPAGGEASASVKAVISAAPMATAASEPAEADFATVLESDGEGTVKWRPTTHFTKVRFQILRNGAVDPDFTVTRVVDATFSGFMVIMR